MSVRLRQEIQKVLWERVNIIPDAGYLKGARSMPRRKKVELSIAERIAAVEAELETLAAQTKMKKQELKDLKEKQAEADKAKLIEAFIASGKSIDEVVGMLKTE